MTARYDLMMDWLAAILPGSAAAVTPASTDASFRRYFRVRHDGVSVIVMDAPPDQEDCRPFVAIAQALAQLGLTVPKVLAADLDRGFLLLTDLGERQYLPALNAASVESLYADALAALVRLQLGGDPATELLPPYDAALLRRELELFREWYLGRHLQLALGDADHQILDDAFAALTASALEQPRVWVHRDYHSRNLMVVPQGNPGILDFQGALVGPITYDLVSLLRDCYIAWPPPRVQAWALAFRDRLLAEGAAGLADAATFLRWFDLMGVQRHLKALGIFARLHHRDGKPGYLNDIPRTLGYVAAIAPRHPPLAGLGRLLRQRVIAP